MIAISTAWIPEDGWPAERVFATMDILEPEAIELNYRVHPLNIGVVRRQVEERGWLITSLHNICSTNPSPLPSDKRYGDTIASLDEDARRLAAAHLRETAEAARALRAGAVVVHSGAVEAVNQSPIYRQNMKRAVKENNPSILAQHLPELLRERAITAPRHLAQFVKSLREVCPDFPDIQFGLEIRYHFHGLPDFDELEIALSEAGCDNVGYWHDCGHGQVQDNLGIRCHEDWLKRYQSRLIGIHLHGMQSLLLDHQAPTKDNMDFAMIRRYTSADTLLVIEANHSNSVEAMRTGKKYLEDIFQNGSGVEK